MIVFWTRNARRELQAVHDHIDRNSPRYALGLVDRIIRKSEQLILFPHLGAEVPEYREPSVRELPEHPYRIIYRIREETDRCVIGSSWGATASSRRANRQ